MSALLESKRHARHGRSRALCSTSARRHAKVHTGVVEESGHLIGRAEQLLQATRRFAEWRRTIKLRFGWLAPLRIVLYGGYGNGREVLVRGRVLEEQPGPEPALGDRRLANFLRAWEQLESDEVPGVQLCLEVGGASADVVTDAEGYFSATMALAARPRPGWLPLHARVTQVPYPTSLLPVARTELLIPSEQARFGVISDIDDTILRTHVGNMAKMLYLTLLGNALTRRSFDGTRELYHGLALAGAGAPFFYVSKSVWNIFPLLEQFIREQGLPRGPLLLRKVRLLRDRTLPEHKPGAITHLLETYPRLSFVLVGDSGEHDLEIYLEIARQHPGRIGTILIRNVSSPERADALRRITQRQAPPGCSVLLFDDTQQAIRHCRNLELWREG
ncbi:MAG: phosphatase domain-containing protein [Deltaproteobacteria bacterium]